jgi:two-component system, OmpR family, response regulator TctD
MKTSTRHFDPRYSPESPLVLLAEDDGELRSLLRGVLRQLGYSVLEAPDGARLKTMVQSLLQSGHEPRPELIVSDVRLPGASGLEVLSTLRAHDWYTPVILMTGIGSPTLEAEALELGATAVFSKPFPIESFRTCVQDVIPIV